jgi:hypothetical protein
MKQTIAAMQLAVEKQEKCVATHFESRIVSKNWGGAEVSHAGETFDLRDHSEGVKRAFIWERFADGERRSPEYTITPGVPAVNTADGAVQAFIDGKLKEMMDRE